MNLDPKKVCPSCTCPDWIRYHIPCKHMFAVFHSIDGYSWENLPALYLKSSYHVILLLFLLKKIGVLISVSQHQLINHSQ